MESERTSISPPRTPGTCSRCLRALDDGATSSIRLLVVSGSPPETVVQPPSRSMMAANPPVPGFSEQSPAVLMTVFAATVCYFWRLCALCLRWSVSPLGGLGRASRPAHALGLENPAAAACPPPPRSRSWAGEPRRCRVSAAALLPGYVGYVRPAPGAQAVTGDLVAGSAFAWGDAVPFGCLPDILPETGVPH